MLLNVVNVWFRDLSPAAIKNEPEEDNGFYPSPQYNKASRRQCDDEEFVSPVLNSCNIFNVWLPYFTFVIRMIGLQIRLQAQKSQDRAW